MLKEKKITYDEIKESLINSDEYKQLEIMKKFDGIENISPDVRNSINELYLEILLRPADDDGLIYYSAMLESDSLSLDDIREILLNSEEIQYIQSQN